MEEGSKRRLVGAAVIVLLVVVFVPMLFEERMGTPVPEDALTIPPRPTVDQDFAPQLAEPPDEPAPPSPEEPALLPPELPPPALYGDPGTTDEAPVPERESVQAAVPETPAESPPPVRQPAGADLSSWVVQVAALTELPRARGLEEELRGKGFPAFIEQADVRGKTFYRVRIGPEADRKRIEAIAVSLREKTGHEGQIKRYP